MKKFVNVLPQSTAGSCKTTIRLTRSRKITISLATILQDSHSSCTYANDWNIPEQDQHE